MKYYFNKTTDSMFEKEQNRGIYDVSHKAFSFVVCVANDDPLRLGRIRGVAPFGSGSGGSSRNNDPTVADTQIYDGKKVQPWSKDDPFLYNSFSSYHLNMVPMVGELFTAISQESPKSTLNQFYLGTVISHPANSKMDKWTNALTITAAEKQNSTTGEPYLQGKATDNVTLVPQISKKGVFPNPEDVAIIGRYNTDIVLGMREYSLPDDNEGSEVQSWYPQILIRSGKFKKVADSEVPDTNPKSTFIQLNTFPTTMKAVEVEEPTDVSNDDYLRNMIVYHLDTNNLTDPTGSEWDFITGWVAAYSLNNATSAATNNYDLNNVQSYMAGEYDLSVDIPGITTPVVPTTNNYWVKYSFSGGLSKRDVAKQISKFISYIDEGEWNKLTKMLDATATPPEKIKTLPKIFPLYFRPDRTTLDLMEKNDTVVTTPFFQAKKDVANYIKSKINLDGVTTDGYGLALTENSGERDIKVETTIEKVRKIQTGLQGQQGIVSIGSEKIYLLSHDINYLGNINLQDNHYGISQRTYIENIDQYTNSTVRGEKLIELLEKMADFMQNHCHAWPGLAPVPQAHGGTRVEDIGRLLADAPKTILNKNIRIN